MILYQLAKRLDERNRLQHTIESSEGDVEALQTRKEEMEEQLQTQANVWTEAGQDEFLLPELMVELDWQQSESYI